MRKLLAVIVASTLALGATAGFAADVAKKEELTKEDRMEMRTRADKLVAERAANPQPVKATTEKATAPKKNHARKTKKNI